MAIRTAIWKIGNPPAPLAESRLATEKQLEEMIVAAPDLLDDQYLLIGQQVQTAPGGYIDLLALDPTGSLVVIELKRNQTPREVVAQSLDYASWVQELRLEKAKEIYSRFKPGCDLEADIRTRFGQRFELETLGVTHQVVIVAASLDESTERIVSYLSGQGVAINVLIFQVFTHGGEQFISRSWLIDPAETLDNAATAPRADDTADWNGEIYVNYGHGESRSWPEALQHGFICAGGGYRYSGPLRRLKPGNRVWVNVPGHGYGGVAEVTGEAEPSETYQLRGPDGEMQRALEVLKHAKYHADAAPDRAEYFVPVKWLQADPLEHIVRESGLFGYQGTVSRPRSAKWAATVDRLKQRFPKYDSV